MPIPIPKGLHHSAQGCELASYPGSTSWRTLATLKGLQHISLRVLASSRAAPFNRRMQRTREVFLNLTPQLAVGWGVLSAPAFSAFLYKFGIKLFGQNGAHFTKHFRLSVNETNVIGIGE